MLPRLRPVLLKAASIRGKFAKAIPPEYAAACSGDAEYGRVISHKRSAVTAVSAGQQDHYRQQVRSGVRFHRHTAGEGGRFRV